MNISANQAKILISTLAASALPPEAANTLISELANRTEINALALAQTFGSPKLTRELKLATKTRASETSLQLEQKGTQVLYQGQIIGKIQILYKSPLPGELQSRLAIESAIDRFLEYLQKVHHIVALDESNYHVSTFIPNIGTPTDFKALWEKFLREVAFSDYGDTKHQLPGLVQTFIVMLNSVTLAGRGFSTLDVPIVTRQQANILAAWYRAVIRDVQERQTERQRQINNLRETQAKEKELQDKEAMQAKEAKKYNESFQKSFGKFLTEQDAAWQEIISIQQQLEDPAIATNQRKKLQTKEEKLSDKITLSRDSVQEKLKLFEQSDGNPFRFLELDGKQNPHKFKEISHIAKIFNKPATDQINSTRGDIFTQCISEMYRLLESEQSEPLPAPLLTEQPVFPEVRSPGDDSKEFCYSCGVASP